MIDATCPDPRTPRPARPERRRWVPLALSLGLHAIGLGLGVWLYTSTGAPVAPIDRAARLALQVPRDAEAVPSPADADPLPLLRPQDVEFEFRVPVPVPAPATDLDDLSEEAPPAPRHAPLQLLGEVPIEAVRVRVRVAPPVALPPPPPQAPSAAPRTRPGAPLRVVYQPDLRLYYPREMQLRGIEGRAIVRIVVDRRGRVIRATLVRSSGWPLLDRQALRVMNDYRFAPGDGGEAEAPVDFRLR